MEVLMQNSARKTSRRAIARTIRNGALIGVAGLALAGCSSIRETRGFVVDPVLTQTVQPGIDNQRSVEGVLGRPTFANEGRITNLLQCYTRKL